MLSFITVNYNSSKLVKKLLLSLNQYMTDNWELIVVDNCSEQNDINRLMLLQSLNKRVNILLEKENIGFGKACNIGVNYAKGEVIILINPDVVLIENGLENFINKNLVSNIGLLAPRILNEDFSIQPNGGGFTGLSFYIFYSLKNIIHIEKLKNIFLSKIFKKTSYNQYLKNFNQDNNLVEYDWVSGAFMIMKKSLFIKIGGFDKNFFMYTEDKDLCFQIRNKLNLKILVDTSYRVVHSVAGTQERKINPDMEIVKFKSRIYYLYKNFGRCKAVILKYYYVLIVFLQSLLTGKFSKKHLENIYQYKYIEDSITIVGYYGSGNVGDECILYALLNEYQYSNSIVLSNNKDNTQQLHLITAYSKKNIISLFKVLINTERLLIGGGGLFLKDNTATYIYFYVLSFLFRMMNKKVYLDGIGLNEGSLNTRLHTYLFEHIARNAYYIKVRDEFSFNLIKNKYNYNYNLIKKIFLRNDFVFDYLDKWKKENNFHKKNKIVGISLMDISYNEDNLYKLIEKYLDLGYLLKFYLFFSEEGDLSATKKLINKFNIKNYEIKELSLQKVEDFDLLFKDLLKNEIFISMRFHPMLISYQLGAKVYVYPHNSKIKSFATKYGLGIIK